MKRYNGTERLDTASATQLRGGGYIANVLVVAVLLVWMLLPIGSVRAQGAGGTTVVMLINRA